MTDEHHTTEESLLDRVVLPVGIPLLAILVVEVFAFSLSRVLLTAGRTPAVVVALAAALGILLGAALVAARPRLRQSTLAGVFVVVMVAVVAGGVWAAQQGPAPLPEHGGEPEHEGEASVVEITAENIAFDTDTLELHAGEPVTLRFDNQDAQPHNVAIYETEEASEILFLGEIFTGPDVVDYEVPALDAGEYYFRCDVHPAMQGSVVVE